MSHEFDLEAIRAKAKELGVAYHPAQKAETIQFNIDQFLEANAPTIIQPPVKDETPAERAKRKRDDALGLIPVTITSMDPQDAQLTAVVVSVGNRKMGQITKAIPFGMKWYMPRILVDHIEAQMFCRSAMLPVPGVTGGERLNTQWIKKYAVQRHNQPTPKELAELAKAQALGNELAK
jgi:hypothetical protein